MFVNWNYIILVVLTVEFHITKTSKKRDSPVFLESETSKNWTVPPKTGQLAGMYKL